MLPRQNIQESVQDMAIIRICFTFHPRIL